MPPQAPPPGPPIFPHFRPILDQFIEAEKRAARMQEVFEGIPKSIDVMYFRLRAFRGGLSKAVEDIRKFYAELENAAKKGEDLNKVIAKWEPTLLNSYRIIESVHADFEKSLVVAKALDDIWSITSKRFRSNIGFLHKITDLLETAQVLTGNQRALVEETLRRTTRVEASLIRQIKAGVEIASTKREAAENAKEVLLKWAKLESDVLPPLVRYIAAASGRIGDLSRGMEPIREYSKEIAGYIRDYSGPFEKTAKSIIFLYGAFRAAIAGAKQSVSAHRALQTAIISAGAAGVGTAIAVGSLSKKFIQAVIAANKSNEVITALGGTYKKVTVGTKELYLSTKTIADISAAAASSQITLATIAAKIGGIFTGLKGILAGVGGAIKGLISFLMPFIKSWGVLIAILGMVIDRLGFYRKVGGEMGAVTLRMGGNVDDMVKSLRKMTTGLVLGMRYTDAFCRLYYTRIARVAPIPFKLAAYNELLKDSIEMVSRVLSETIPVWRGGAIATAENVPALAAVLTKMKLLGRIFGITGDETRLFVEITRGLGTEMGEIPHLITKVFQSARTMGFHFKELWGILDKHLDQIYTYGMNLDRVILSVTKWGKTLREAGAPVKYIQTVLGGLIDMTIRPLPHLLAETMVAARGAPISPERALHQLRESIRGQTFFVNRLRNIAGVLQRYGMLPGLEGFTLRSLMFLERFYGLNPITILRHEAEIAKIITSLEDVSAEGFANLEERMAAYEDISVRIMLAQRDILTLIYEAIRSLVTTLMDTIGRIFAIEEEAIEFQRRGIETESAKLYSEMAGKPEIGVK